MVDGTKLYQTIIAALEQEIRAGAYPRGSRLPTERELAERFGVSRLTVREAMVGMEIMGLVEARRGSGIHVSRTNAKTPRPLPDLDIGEFELTEVRRLIEGEAAGLAAVTATPEDIQYLRDQLDLMIRNKTEGSHDEESDREFHIGIAKATHNQVMVMVVSLLWDIRYRSPLAVEMMERVRRADVEPRAIADHEAVLKAIAARDANGARAAMRQHLERVIEQVLAATELDAVEKVRQEAADRRSRVSATA